MGKPISKVSKKPLHTITIADARGYLSDIKDAYGLGVPDPCIDAFCGRVPRPVLARHYTDCSSERLKRIYDRANLKVLS